MKKNNKTYTKKKVAQKDKYLSNLSSAIVLAAKEDKTLAKYISEKFLGRDFKFSKNVKAGEYAYVLMPSSTDMAIRKFDWLLELENEEALAPLISWSKSYEDEQAKNLVVGIVGMAIPGVTLGIIKKRFTMNFLIKKSSVKKSALVNIGIKSSTNLLSRCIKKVNGNTNKLEPELYDWLHGDRDVQFFDLENNSISDIGNMLTELGVDYVEIRQNTKTIGYTISPVVNDDFFHKYKKISL
ncbi:hypothetical protein C0584_00430 [Candidatus Parcubacteria bacterium]|nr:MAG: hypothetical protein C0584_00430 [Candidatus Parcubacteria bacterium]